jgi:hypothetical protein
LPAKAVRLAFSCAGSNQEKEAKVAVKAGARKYSHRLLVR